MSATNPTFGEIRFQCQKRFPGQDPDVLDSLINERYRRALRRLDWQRLKVQAVLQTVAEYNTGTVTVTKGSTAIALADGSWTSAMSGRAIRIGSDDAFYQFAQTGAFSGTLDRPYEGEDSTDVEYSIWQAIYVLPSDLNQLQSMRVFGSGRDLDQVSQEDLDEQDAARTDLGTPERYALHMDDLSTPPRRQVELYPGPDELLSIPFWYTQDPELFGSGDTGDFIAPWLNPDEIYLGVEADVRRGEKDYAGAQLAEQLRGVTAAETNQAECRRIGPQPLKMASMYTRHNRRRWQR
jgi:hypothetical protein